MTSLFTDYGYRDGKIHTTNAADKFTVDSADHVGRAAYKITTNLETAAGYAQRAARMVSENTRLRDEQLEAVKHAARDVEMAIAAVIAEIEARAAKRHNAARDAA